MTSQPGRASVLLGLLVLLAGCNYASGPTPADNTTPAEVPDGTVTPLPSFPPGVTSGEIVDAAILSRNHSDALESAAFTTNRTRRERYANGTLRYSVTEKTRYASKHDKFFVVSDVDGTYNWSVLDVQDFKIWSDGNVTVREVNTSSSTSYANGEVPGYPDYTYAGHFYVVAAAIDSPNVTETVHNDRRAFRIEDDSIDQPRPLIRVIDTAPNEIDRVRNASVLLLVRPNGLIRRVTVSFTITTDGTDIHVVEVFRISNVDSTTVPQPEWVQPFIQ